jgi:hypothetical protein
MEALIQLVKDIGPFSVLLLMAAAWFYDRSKPENKAESTLSDVAGNSIIIGNRMDAMQKQQVETERSLGRAEGQNIALLDRIKTSEIKWEADKLVMTDKIYALTDTSNKQAATISRHEGRIAELETEGKRKDELILSKEKVIVELKVDNARLTTQVEILTTDKKDLERELQLMTRVQSLDETIPLGDELLEKVNHAPDMVLEMPIVELPTPVNEDKKDVA